MSSMTLCLLTLTTVLICCCHAQSSTTTTAPTTTPTSTATVGCFMKPYSAFPWCNRSLDAGERTGLLMKEMTEGEKGALLYGVDGPYTGNTAANTRLGIPALRMNDGPQGFRGEAGTSTQFPCSLAVAATFDPEAAEDWGRGMGTEFVGKGANVQLGPGLNVERVPLDGRNFEYLSGEDPALGRAMAAAAVVGIQSTGTIANAKHYINNNQETNRTTVSANLDERTRMQLYAQPFWGAVEGGVWSVMCAYNRINDSYACQNDQTLNTELKEYMGFEGWVMSDWGATHSTVASANHGLDQQMPDDSYYGAALRAAVAAGLVSQEAFDGHAARVLLGMFSLGLFDRDLPATPSANVTSSRHALLAEALAVAGTVLLTNPAQLLPLSCPSLRSVLFLGAPADASPVTGGQGSGQVTPAYQVSPLQGLQSFLQQHGSSANITYYAGNDTSVAYRMAAEAQVVVSVLATMSGEGSDRPNLDLPAEQLQVTRAAAKANAATVALVIAPGPVLLPFAEEVGATLLMFFPGQQEGDAFAQVLCGTVSPGGRLPVTIPSVNNEVGFTTLQYPGVANEEYYTEKLEIGYRWYHAHNVRPHFPFGFGLSYTTWSYSALSVDPASLLVTFTLSNTGSSYVSASEVAQLYITYPSSAGEPPVQLRGFQKASMDPGVSTVLSFQLTSRDLSIWDVTSHKMVPVSGTFLLYVGPNSQDLPLSTSFTIA